MMASNNLLFIALATYLSCNSGEKGGTVSFHSNESVKRNFDFIWNAKQIHKDQIETSLRKIDDSLCFEVIDLYPPTDSIPENDFLILDDSLRQRGFVVISTGRGNWLKGPRVISMNLENDSFTCRLDKLYYTDTIDNHLYKVTERIACLRK